MKWEIVSHDEVRIKEVCTSDGPAKLRVVTLQDPETSRFFEFLTNNHKLAATTICAITELTAQWTRNLKKWVA